MSPDEIMWLQQQVASYRAVKATYGSLAETLGLILGNVRDRCAPFGRVDARAKSIASFAEKALRKQRKYNKPLERMTDLAGARIVVYTIEDAQAVCRFIEAEPGFRIDWKNSMDVRRQMKAEEFGYEAVHYVVELCMADILGVKVPPEVQSIAGKRSFKAEIQVHTMLQNAWSMIGHDRLYKTQVKVPEGLKRSVHAVAAILESADQSFARAVKSLDHYIRHFEAYKKPDELEDDIELWRTIHDEDPNDPAAIYELGRRLMAAHRWEEAYQTLELLQALGKDQRSGIQTDLGLAASRVPGVPVEEAREHLEAALALDSRNVRRSASWPIRTAARTSPRPLRPT